ncbi:hypothetical protein FE257_003272 [Aspergillus nanangensis]|uniref:DUF4604 domain-containing protein n=1 Tax=Aspergillus nanangensis TaxID=2582783 RepID=A0AAD4GWF2_ASPNN|nr:hypothetical protein FE257_003272 [Aspergillus nanangensis]
MSFKAKDLAYDAKEPAFLQKLRGQYGSQDGRLERPTTRPRKPKADTGDDDDEPTYVDEETNEVITKEDYAALVRGNDQQDPEGNGKSAADQTSPEDVEDKPTAEKDAPISKQAIAEIGGPKKRKQAKVVVGEDHPPAGDETENAPRKDPGSRKPKQKKKKIKLSFDDET